MTKQKTIPLLLLLVSGIFSARGQTGNGFTLIGASGGSDTEGTFSWSLGEVATQTNPVDTLNNQLTNGFQQATIWMVGIEETAKATFEAKVFPTPTEKFLNIELSAKAPKSIHASLTTLSGQEVLSAELKSSSQLNLSSIASGTYFLSIAETSNTSNKLTFKIIKN